MIVAFLDNAIFIYSIYFAIIYEDKHVETYKPEGRLYLDSFNLLLNINKYK